MTRVRPRPRPLVALLLAAANVALTGAGGCGGRPSSAPREEKVEFAEAAPPAGAPVAPAPAAARARGVADAADLSGKGVAGGASGTSAPAMASSAVAESAAAPMLIRTGTASVEVDSLDAAVARVRALAARVGGYVANTSLAAGREQVRSATLELRVPAARFDELVGGLAPFGRVEKVDVQAEDVGEEFVDVSARVANARRLEGRLVELLARRTGKLEEVLAVERELARVREEIERYEGRLRYLRTRAATSTLAVTVHERAPLLAERPNATPVADAFRSAGRNFVALLAAVIATSGVWVPLGAVAYGAWRWRRRREAAAAALAVTRRGPPPPGTAPSAASAS